MDTIAQKLRSAPRILVLTHEHPDGDAIGSAVALTHILRTLGCVTTTVCADAVPEPFRFLTEGMVFENAFTPTPGDVVVTLDCGDLKRTGFAQKLVAFRRGGGTLIHIDHHPKSDLSKLATYNLVDSTASSTAEVLWRLFGILGFERVPKEVATALLCGVFTDTGGFRHSNTSPHSFILGATLLSCGARLRWIRENVSMHKSVSALKLWGIAFERIHRHRLAIVSSVVTREDLETTGATDEDIAGIVNMLSAVPDTRLAMMIAEQPDYVLKASMRTEDEHVDVGAIATLFGGGGHKKAAGFTLPGRIIANDGHWKIELDSPQMYTFQGTILQDVMV